MSDTPPPALLQDNLTPLAASIRAEHLAVSHAAGNLLQHAMAAGDALIAAHKHIDHGRWEGWLENHCDLNPRTARRYIQLAESRALLESKRSRATDLSLAGALRILGDETKSSTKRSAKKTTAIPKLSSLSWSDASVEERRAFLNTISLSEVLGAMPGAWREALRQRVLGLAETHATPGARAIIRSERARQPFDLELTADTAA